ncbi:hypothetical protein [Porphyrobacter sp. YT40]|uniref:hypothetical protein n=1 Tax=Porphyrobacter sp. YT40 TaxID=2547601 RepID=UPI001144E3CE|nr:hypothetical protein [Porphyrobacter sp. YT40]QDH35563.1 hypothetical protein E2E27_15325 [Porphyrobacter sp. YT40]
MLKIPEVKFGYSANQSNVDPNAMGDWLEACALFDGPDVTKGDVIDMLLEYQICSDENQDLAHLIAEEGWEEVSKRKRWGGLPDHVDITVNRISSQGNWRDDPIRSFFVLLSALRIYPDWAKDFQAYSVQGDLFERIVEVICPHLLPGWIAYRAGWSPDDTKNIPEIVGELVNRLYVPGAADLDRWLLNAGNDGGLDMICYRSFGGEREAMPLFFLQCASGKNWRDKIHTPNPNLWQKFLDSAVLPSTGIVAPFVIDDKELRIAALIGQIVVFDRIRLLSAARDGDVQLDDGFRDEVIDWLQPRIDGLPRVT